MSESINETPARSSFRIVQWITLFAAVAHTLATLFCIYAFREGQLHEMSMVKLLAFSVDHSWLWRACCISVSVAAVSFLAFVLAVRELLESRFRYWLGTACCLAIIAVANDLPAHSSMMVLLSDLARQYFANFALREFILQDAWSVLNQAITQTFLVSNSLYSAAGILLTVCMVLTRNIPRWLGWVGVPVWFATTLTSLFAFTGNIPSAMITMFASSILFVIWSVVIGVVMERRVHEHDPVALGTQDSVIAPHIEET